MVGGAQCPLSVGGIFRRRLMEGLGCDSSRVVDSLKRTVALHKEELGAGRLCQSQFLVDLGLVGVYLLCQHLLHGQRSACLTRFQHGVR